MFPLRRIALILTLTLLASTESILAEPKVRRNVEIELEPVDGASLYEIQVKRKDERGAPALHFKTKKPTWSATIKPGTYEMQVRSYDGRGAPGDWSPPTDIQVKLPAIIVKGPNTKSTIKAQNTDSENVRLAWEPVPGANGYKVQLKNEDGSFSKDKDVGSPEWTADLPVGHAYSWNVAAIDYRGDSGDLTSEGYQFELRGPPLKKPRVTKPLSKYVKQLTWSAPDHATTYSYELTRYNSSSKTWETIAKGDNLKEPKVDLDVSKPSGRYFLSVQAHANYWEPSEKGQLEFYMEGGFKDVADVDNAMIRQSIIKPTHYYAIASYLITKITYSADDWDDNSNPKFEALGGTGRLGAGYQDPASNWGGFGIVDYSGFTIEGKTFYFASMELHATRRLEFGQRGLLQLASGLFIKELPVVKGYTETGFTGVGTIRGIGPHVGFTYWLPLGPKLGLQANARVYYSLLGSSPNGSSIESTLSFQGGLLGSYRLTRRWMGYAGYAYRLDQAAYPTKYPDTSSYAREGQTNQVNIQGHYLNLKLEWSF